MTTDPYNPLVQDQKLLNEVKYAARDFASMADELLRRLKVEYGTVYNDYASTSQGIMLRDLVAWAYAGLTWYLDRTASDSFLQTARTVAATERLVEQIAYKMSPAAPASARLELIFPDGTEKGFVMKERWQYRGAGGFIYEAYAKYTQATALPLDPDGTNPITIDVRQGETRTLTYTADGSKNQTYRLSSIDEDRFLAVNSAEVWVDGQIWEEVDFLEYRKDPIFEISYLANPPIIRFGDGNAGKIPPVGAEVKIRFVIIDGDQGNLKSNAIQSSVDTLTIDGEVVTFTVNNPLKATGGLNPEDAEKAKRFAPVSFAARGAAITQADYEGLSGSFVDPAYGAVAKSYAINPRSSFDDLTFNNMVSTIDGLLTQFNTDVTALEAEIKVDSDSLTGLLATLNTALFNLETLRTDILGWAGAAQTAAESARDQCVNANTSAESAQDYGSNSAITLGNLEDWVSTNINTASQRAHLLTEIGSAKLASANASDEANSASGFAIGARGAITNTVIPNLGLISDAVVGLDQGGNSGVMYQYNQSATGAAASIEETISGEGGIQDKLATIVGDAATLYTEVMAEVSDMQIRIGELFSDDCLSNFVSVPILALDSEGNYSAPSIGLKVGLQRYLNGIKEITQVVEVVDGSDILMPADLHIKVKVLAGYVPAEVISQIDATIVGMLKGRDFNQPLYLSDVYDAVIESSKGIDYVNISISGPTNKQIEYTDGNMITLENQVIIYGSLVIQDLDEVI